MVRRPGFVAVAKVQVPVKDKLWVREFMSQSEGKHKKKTELKTLQKEEDTKSS